MSITAANVEEVTIEGDALVISHMRVGSEVVVAAAKERTAGTSLSQWTEQALEVGARATSLASASNGMVALRAQVKHLTGEVAHVTTALGERLSDVTHPDSGTITTAVRRELASLSQQVHGLVAGENAPVRAAMARTLADAEQRLMNEAQRLSTQHAAALKSVVDLDDGDKPLGALRATVERLDRSLSDLQSRWAADVAVEVERARGTAKGADYEEAVASLLADIANKAGDECHTVGGVEGTLPGSKKGDVVLAVGDGTRTNVVVEVKDRKQGLAAWKRYMAEACRNRSAQVSIAVVRSTEQVPASGPVQCVGDDLFFVAVEPGDRVSESLLVAVYRLARARALALTATTGESDSTAVEAAIRSAQEQLEGASEIIRRARRASTEADAVAMKVVALTDGVQAALAEALEAVTGPGDEEAF